MSPGSSLLQGTFEPDDRQDGADRIARCSFGEEAGYFASPISARSFPKTS